MSTTSTPKSSITLLNHTTQCGLISSVCTVAAALPDIDGIPIALCNKTAQQSLVACVHSQPLSFSSSSTETVYEPRHHGGFSDAYQKHSRTAHMGLLDPSYQVFNSPLGNGAVVYKIKAHTLVVTGDPLCSPEQFTPLLDELRTHRSNLGLKIAFMGVSETFMKYARSLGWATLHFGRETVLNPMTNPVTNPGLGKGAGKRMISQTRQLLDPKRGAITIHLYSPSTTGREPTLEAELQTLYDCWREERNSKYGPSSQAFVTVYDLFSRPEMTLFLYTNDRNGCANGLAMLRSLGANGGFHLDPCIASPSAPRGVGDLLVIAAMKLLARTGIDYLSLGYEPFADLHEITGQSSVLAWLTQKGYRRAMRAVPVDGKAAYYSKFRPDVSVSSDLYIVVPRGVFQVQQSAALMHMANLKMSSLFSLSNTSRSKETSVAKG